MSKDNRLEGYRRDKAILQEVEKRKVLTTDQIHQLFFSHLSQGKRICQRRLKTLCEARKLKRHRITLEAPFYYYTEAIKQVEHMIETNWLYVKFRKELPAWESLIHWAYEVDYGILRCDAFVGIKNNISGAHRFYFVETDLSDNKFDKVEKYNDLFEQGHNWWWAKYATVFPTVIIKTYRTEHVLKKIEKENRNNLRLEVVPLTSALICTVGMRSDV